MPALILQLTRIGFLILLCLFVLAAMRVVRSDLRYAADPRADGGARSRGGGGQDQRQASAGRLHPSIHRCQLPPSCLPRPRQPIRRSPRFRSGRRCLQRRWCPRCPS